MQTKPISAIVMAGGKGTRLKSHLPKVLHPLYGQPLLRWVIKSLSEAIFDCQNVYVVVGHGRDQVQKTLDCLSEGFPNLQLSSVVQEPQLGTGHAVQQVKQAHQLDNDVLILSGDVPLLTSETLERLIDTHQTHQADLTVLVAELDNPTGYGRVILKEGQVQKIVEEKDASPAEKVVKTVNTGIYCLNWKTIAPLLDQLSSNNAQGEFYLTDVIGMAVAQQLQVISVFLPDALEMCGINTRLDLSMCHEILNQRTLARLMDNGVTVLNPASVLIGPEVTIGADTVIYPGCHLAGQISIGSGCTIGPNTTMLGTVSVGDRSQVLQSWLANSSVGNDSLIGPFAHLRDNAQVTHHVKIGNFVEVKNSVIGENSFASHLAYIGDAKLGQNVNFAAGAITANYDPITEKKETTIIEDGVKVGCNAVLVAPVTIAERSSVAAGSVITKNVSPWALAIARERQTELTDWVKKKLDQKSPVS